MWNYRTLGRDDFSVSWNSHMPSMLMSLLLYNETLSTRPADISLGWHPRGSHFKIALYCIVVWCMKAVRTECMHRSQHPKSLGPNGPSRWGGGWSLLVIVLICWYFVLVPCHDVFCTLVAKLQVRGSRIYLQNEFRVVGERPKNLSYTLYPEFTANILNLNQQRCQGMRHKIQGFFPWSS